MGILSTALMNFVGYRTGQVTSRREEILPIISFHKMVIFLRFANAEIGMSGNVFNCLIIFSLITFSCSEKRDKPKLEEPTLFKLLDSTHTHIDFVNQLDYSEAINTYTYKSFYNGGGVGLGDFNNDGLIDIFFSGNIVSNRLYLNNGNFQFQDISESAGLGLKGVWTTGVSIVDINADGFLDIYLCKSGPPGGIRRYNELFINNGDLTFTEQSKEYGLAYEGLSTHAAFFDFDKDGDLDCYLLNNSIRSVGGFDIRVGQRSIPDPLGGNKLLRNDEGKFTDVSAQAGIYTSEIGFGLGVTVADINKDGWPDMYVSNDFFERDYLYMNNQDGTFRETLEESLQEISLGSMGADIADINNDGLPEIYVTEMLPERDDRLKTTTQFENWDKYNLSLKNGYFRQFSRNVLQLNNGDDTFSEIARLSGVHATDWSWGALIFDMDNDGLKDIFVANGIYKELLNQDYVNFATNPGIIREIMARKKGVITQLIDSIPSTPIPNYAFQNTGNLSFKNKATEWGLDLRTFSNGSAYGDLDNDGDLDLVLNNVNMPALIYENRSTQFFKDNKTISIVLHGEDKNLSAIGAKVTLKMDDRVIYQESYPTRGFMSSVDNRLHFGLGNVNSIDSILVEWPNDKVTILTNVPPDQVIDLFQTQGAGGKKRSLKKLAKTKSLFTKLPGLAGVDFVHSENDFVDFDRDRLLFNMVSNEGPCICAGDINQDGFSDFYIGGAKDQAGALFIQQKSGTFVSSNAKVFEIDKASEDTDCIFFDADGDGKDDLYVTSGGNEFSSNSTALVDRLYLNKGGGELQKSPQFPVLTSFESTSTVIVNDWDKDGDQDLFVGSRLIPFLYGAPANGYILINDGKGNFTDVTKTVAPQLLKLGLITDAKWIDANNDGNSDLMVVGEWMSIKLFMNENGIFADRSAEYGFTKTNGWYSSVEVGDFNKDGWVDFVAGNHGLNSRFKASESEPVSMYINDFDQNGSIENIITRYDSGVSYPLVLRQDLVMQIPSLKKKYLRYKDYSHQTITDIFSAEQLRHALVLDVYTFATSAWMNNKNGTFSRHDLPIQAQFSPVYAVYVDDFNRDNNDDLLLGGNLHKAKPETGIYAGSYGLLLKGDGQGNFESVSAQESGLNIRGEIRGFEKIMNKGKPLILIGKNNAQIEVLSY